jgi:choline dehydrogenase
MSETSTHERLDAEFAREVEENQRRLRGALQATHDFIVCGSGSSGAVVARRAGREPERLGAADRGRRERQRA